MTIKELAVFTGKEDRTIRRWVKIAGDKNQDIVQKVKEAFRTKCPMDLTIDEVELVLKSGSLSKDAVYIMMESARNNRPTTQVVDYEMIGKMIGMAVMAALTPVVDRLDILSNGNQLQIEAPKQDYFSLVAYCSLHKIKTNMSELKKMGMDLRKMTKEYGKELRKIPDERWGEVNSYPVEILDEYFSE